MLPAFAGLLGSMGLTVLLQTAYFVPLTVATLLLAVSALACRARGRRGYAPFLVGVVAAAGVLVGKFVWDLPLVTYAGLALLIAASIWNACPRKKTHPIPLGTPLPERPIGSND